METLFSEKAEVAQLSIGWKVCRAFAILALPIPWLFFLVFLGERYLGDGTTFVGGLTWLVSAPLSLLSTLLFPILAFIERKSHGESRFWWIVTAIASAPLLTGIAYTASRGPSVFGSSL